MAINLRYAKRTKLIRSTLQTFANTTTTAISWSSAEIDEVSAWSSGAPTNIVGPALYNRVRFVLCASTDTNTLGNTVSDVSSGTQGVMQTWSARTNDAGLFPWRSRWFSYTPGEVFQARLWTSSGSPQTPSSLSDAPLTYLECEWATYS